MLPSLSTALAARIEGQLLTGGYGQDEIGYIHPLTKLQLNRGRFTTTVFADGQFSFSDVPSGEYVLEVKSPQFTFAKVHLYVTTSGEVHASRYSIGDDWASTRDAMPYPLVLRPRKSPTQYLSPESRKVVEWFSRPYILMASFCVFMMIIMPTLSANLDPETLHALRSLPDHPLLPDRPDLRLHVGYGGQFQTQPPIGMPSPSTSSMPSSSSLSSSSSLAPDSSGNQHGAGRSRGGGGDHAGAQASCYAKASSSTLMNVMPTASNPIHQHQPFRTILGSTSAVSSMACKKRQ
ncbi:hypothetical protein BGW41_005611 [Actinomortierella wolfii]|nr:hypothetical protein BGW41_005611 [Actinomortierella wolfii]